MSAARTRTPSRSLPVPGTRLEVLRGASGLRYSRGQRLTVLEVAATPATLEHGARLRLRVRDSWGTVRDLHAPVASAGADEFNLGDHPAAALESVRVRRLP